MESENLPESESFFSKHDSYSDMKNSDSAVLGGEPGEITCLLSDLSNDDAVEALWRHLFPKLVGLAQSRMGQMPTNSQDEEDVALSAMNSFFAAIDNSEYEFDGREALWRLLVTITARKISRERRRQNAKKRGGGVKHLGNQTIANGDDLIQSIADSSQMPELVEDVYEQCDELLKTLPDDAMRLTAQMKLDGCSNEEISDVLRCKVHETKHRLSKIRENWRRFLEIQE